MSSGPALNLTATLIRSGLIQLSWTPSNEGQIGLFLNCVVLVTDGNGAIAYNETVKYSQFIINPCSQYNATVAPQGTVPVASIGGSQIPGGNC